MIKIYNSSLLLHIRLSQSAMDAFTKSADSFLTKSPKIELITECDFDNKYYFNRTETDNMYHLKFPGIFNRNELRDYSIWAYLECKDDSFRNKYFTTHEYMQMIHKLWDIRDGKYDSRAYFD